MIGWNIIKKIYSNVFFCMKCLQDMHRKAWDQVSDYVKSNLEFFPGRALEAESTILPGVTTWVHDTLGQIAESKTVI